MRRKAKRLITVCLTLLLLTNLLGSTQVLAQGVHVINPNPESIVLVPGETRKIKIPIRAVGATISSPIIIADASGSPYTLSSPILRTENLDVPLNSIYEHFNQYIEMDVVVAETAKIGSYPINLIIQGSSFTNTDGDFSVSTELKVNTQILEEKDPAQLSVNKMSFNNTTIGQDMKLSFALKNDGEVTARNVYISVDYGDTGMIAGYSTKNIKVEDIGAGKEAPIQLPIKILPTATPGIKTVTIKLTHKTEEGETIQESHDIYITLRENLDAPNLILESFSFNKEAKPGDKLGLILNINNSGNSAAMDPRISVDDSSIGTDKFIKDYYTDYIGLKDIKPDQVLKTQLPLIISKETTGGLKDLKINLVYFDEKGVEYKSTVTIYPDIEAEGISEDGKPVVIISNVKQSPEKPVAGGKLDVSFNIENKSTMDLNEFKIKINNLGEKTFIPVKSDPYQYVGVLKADSITRVTIPLTISDDIPDGLNNLSIEYSYSGGSDIVDIPILDVQNDLGSASKPRLIVSKYETDIEELKAGSIFNFEFEIHNTHSSVAAKNIIITLSGKDPMSQAEIFTTTHGSNSFFVSKIAPGETFSGSLEMKVKSDTATNAYPVIVIIEYEYEGIEPNPTTGDIGETAEIGLNLQVIENARPVVDYVNVYSYDGMVTVGAPATLAFDFYNMGKSMLNNVIATVEGDFSSSSGDMYFIGNVNAGDRSYAEFEVIPMMEGMAKGLVKVTYEDSNGDEQVYTKEFEASIMGEQIWDGGMNGDGGMDVFNPIMPEPKKAIVPIWLFIIIQVVIIAIFIPVTRKIIISIYKSKLRKEDEEYL